LVAAFQKATDSGSLTVVGKQQEDDGVPIAGSKCMDTIATPDGQKELHRIEGAFHDVMLNSMAEEAMSHMIKFIQKGMLKSS
jgi:alpha-beta hydrolase superfamily lysophospholipase